MSDMRERQRAHQAATNCEGEQPPGASRTPGREGMPRSRPSSWWRAHLVRNRRWDTSIRAPLAPNAITIVTVLGLITRAPTGVLDYARFAVA
jgi:hypothetical protein